MTRGVYKYTPPSVFEGEAEIETDDFFVDRTVARHGGDAHLHDTRLAHDAVLEYRKRLVELGEPYEAHLGADLERGRVERGANNASVCRESLRVVSHNGEIVRGVEEDGLRRHLRGERMEGGGAGGGGAGCLARDVSLQEGAFSFWGSSLSLPARCGG